jgi:hypothetical protein
MAGFEDRIKELARKISGTLVVTSRGSREIAEQSIARQRSIGQTVRDVARKTDQYLVAEVTRLTKNTCSFLYAACARIAKEMGFERIQTFILVDEPGTSLVAAGWSFAGLTDSAPQKWHSRSGRRSDQPGDPKQRWFKELR